MQLFANNATSELNGAITLGSLSITLKTGEGAKFPSPTGGDFFLVTLYQKVGAGETNHEIVKCTARTGDVLTVVRAQEGTTAKAFSNADPVELRETAGTLAAKAELASPTFTGTVAGITKTMVGLSNVDNTTDAAKPVSTAQQTALNLKANLASPAFTGAVTGITASMTGAQPVDNDLTAIAALAGTVGLLRKTAVDTWSLDTAAYTTNTGTVTGVTGTAPISSTGGVVPAISIAAATISAAGSMSAADKTKLDSVATGATANVGDVTLAGVQTLTNKTITETVFVVTGTTPALAATNGAVQTWTLTAASAPTDGLSNGQSIILVITPGAFAITWPSVVWTKQGGSGAAPTLFSAGKTSVVLWKVGAVLYGSHLGDTV